MIPTEVVTLRAQLMKARQDRDAQFAHNTALLVTITELEEDNVMYGGFLGTLQGLLDGTDSTGVIRWNYITDRIRALLEIEAHMKGLEK